MKYIKTYEGIFDFLKKKVTLEDLTEKLRQVISNKEGFKEIYDEGVKFIFFETTDGIELQFSVEISKRDSSVFSLHIICSLKSNEEINDSVGLFKDGPEMMTALEVEPRYSQINHYVRILGKKIIILAKSEEFFTDHPQDEIEDYISDLKDALGDDIRLSKNYQRKSWDLSFHISRGSDNLDSVRAEIDEQIKGLKELLDVVGLRLVSKLVAKEDVEVWTGQRVYDNYIFSICEK
jgi:hypothetical protein